MEKFRWGIIGTGNIAHQFALALDILENVETYAVLSRTQNAADTFAEEFDVKKSYSNIKDFVSDKNIDAVYVATPHPMHKETTIECLKNKKPVLCEKAFAVNSSDVSEMINCAKENNTFLMEAMWTHFFPAMDKIRNIVKSFSAQNFHGPTSSLENADSELKYPISI